MQVGLLSDTHNQIHKVRRAAERLRADNVEVILHAGDVVRPNVLQVLADFDVWIAQGNMDHAADLSAVAAELFGPDHLAAWHDLTLDNNRIALLHGDNQVRLRALIQEETYDYVIHGHTHTPRDETIGGTRIINPGALGSRGWRPGTFAILNVRTGDLTRIEV
jgi:putative phosphoesterase